MSDESASKVPDGPLKAGRPDGDEGAPGKRPPRRKDHSWRYATASDLQRITFTISLGRWSRLHELSMRANRVLRFFASLNRTSGAGYRGTRCYQGALASAIAQATDEPASVRTIQRALAELVEAGYLEQSTSWGRSRQIAPDRWTRDQICVYTLTEKATSIWSHTSLPTTKCRTDDHKKPEFITQSSARATKREESTITPAKCETKAKESADKSTDALKAPPARIEGKSRSTYRREDAKNAILTVLRRLLRYEGRSGSVALSRAAHELSGSKQLHGEHSGVGWRFWLARWGRLSPKERVGVARSQMIPLLLGRSPTPAPEAKSEAPSRALPARSEPPPPVVSDEERIATLHRLVGHVFPDSMVARLEKDFRE